MLVNCGYLLGFSLDFFCFLFYLKVDQKQRRLKPLRVRNAGGKRKVLSHIG